jgi:DNA-binding transcriptional regulator GbsR (MarR family)
MHFRVRKNVIQLIRTTYDPGKKKGVNTTVGAVKLARPELSSEVRRELTPEELSEFETWVETHHRTNTLREELAALTLSEAMAQAEKWFEREGDSISARAAAADIVFQWQSLRKLLAKKGLLD